MEMVDVTVWIVVNENGEAAADCDRDNLSAGDAALATRMVCVTVRVPKPKPVQLVATVDAESEAAELRVA